MELEHGKIITGSFIIKKITIFEQIVEIQLINEENNEIIGLLKNNIDIFVKTCFLGDKIICKGKLRKKRKCFCLDIIYVSKNTLDSQVNEKFDVNLYIDKFNKIISSVIDTDYKKILENCFNDDVKELYFSYPASKDKNHNYKHGLLQHSIEVVEICLFFVEYFKDLNRDLLICASLLHDIGKLKSYDYDNNLKIEKTNWDNLLGHLSISALFLSKITLPDIDEEKIMLLYHLILSHHGELQYGSPIVCKVKESYILNKANDLSSTFNYLDMLSYTNDWSEDKFNRNWFRSKE
jgi:putative nucleotidyltransferase with HDIG domain